MERIALIGSGDFAEQVINVCEEVDELQVVGYFDESREPGDVINGYPVLGCDDDVEKAYKDNAFDSIFVCIGYSNFNLKERVFDKFNHRIPMTSIIHPTAVVNHTSHIGSNVLISEGAIIGKDSQLEDNVTIEPGVLVGHDGHIGKHSFLAGRAALAGKVTVGEKCFIGLNSSIRDGMTIGDEVTIGIGCVVIRDVQNKEVVVGNPQRSISPRGGNNI